LGFAATKKLLRKFLLLPASQLIQRTSLSIRIRWNIRSGHFTVSDAHSGLRIKNWWARQDSNLGPRDSLYPIIS